MMQPTYSFGRKTFKRGCMRTQIPKDHNSVLLPNNLGATKKKTDPINIGILGKGNSIAKFKSTDPIIIWIPKTT